MKTHKQAHTGETPDVYNQYPERFSEVWVDNIISANSGEVDLKQEIRKLMVMAIWEREHLQIKALETKIEHETGLKKHQEKAHKKINVRTNKKGNLFCDFQGCGDVFQFSKLLKKHTNSMHEIRIKPGFPCIQCGKNSKSNAEYDRHALKHTKVQNIEFQMCGKKFKSKKGLGYHVKLHTGQLDHTCNSCDAAYITSAALSIHHRVKHTECHSYYCLECGKQFQYRGTLDKHRTLHTGVGKNQQFRNPPPIT